MKRVSGLLGRLLDAAQIALLALVVATVSWQVVARYVTSASTAWAPELAQIGFVWLSMLAIAAGVRDRTHMLIDVWGAAGGSGTRLGRALDGLAAAAVVAVSLVLAWFGLAVLEVTFKRTMPGLGIKAGWMYLAVPVGFALCALFAVEAWWTARAPRDAAADPTVAKGA